MAVMLLVETELTSNNKIMNVLEKEPETIVMEIALFKIKESAAESFMDLNKKTLPALSELDGYPVKYGSVNIEQNVWLPWSCFIMPGVNIGAGSIVGARSVINRDVPAGVVVAGAPAKVVKEQSHKEMSMEDKVELMAGWIRQFLKLKRLEYKELSSETMVQFVISEKEGFVLSLSPHPQWNSQFLNIVWDTPKVEDLKKYRVYSLNQSVSSKERDLTSLEKSFFIYYRNSGLRYYPFDELAQSEQFIQQRGSDLG